nr:MAG TPA: polynucleotide kinase [Caudoviricetes sp.]
MPKIILTRGIQCSGKSTWAKKWVEEDPTHRVRWNNDDFRRMLGLYWVPERENLVSIVMSDFIYYAMTLGYDIVIDNMNLNKKYWDFIQDQINSLNKRYTLEFKDFFDVSLEECIERDSKRGHPIGEKVITETYNKYKDIIKKLKVK